MYLDQEKNSWIFEKKLILCPQNFWKFGFLIIPPVGISKKNILAPDDFFLIKMGRNKVVFESYPFFRKMDQK